MLNITSGVARISQWEVLKGAWGQSPNHHELEVWGICHKQGGLGAKASALVDFCNFSTKITHFYAYFGQNKHLENSLNVLNRINEVQVL